MKPFLFTAIKTGRYTHEKKTRDIKEVKRLQEVEKLKAEGRYHGDQEAMVDVTDTAELERIVKHITDVHKQHTPHTPEFFAKLPQKEKEFLVRMFILLFLNYISYLFFGGGGEVFIVIFYGGGVKSSYIRLCTGWERGADFWHFRAYILCE